MFRKLNIRIKLIIFITSILLLAMVVIGTVFGQKSKTELLKSISTKLHVINDLKIEKINSHFNKVNSCFSQINKYNDDTKAVEKYLNYHRKKNDTNRLHELNELKKSIRERLVAIQKAYAFQRVIILDLNGYLIFSTNPNDMEDSQEKNRMFIDSKSELFLKAKQENTYSNIYTKSINVSHQHGYFMNVLHPFTINNKLLGIIACETSMLPLYEQIQDTTGLGKESGETILVKRDKDQIKLISPPLYLKKNFMEETFPLNGKLAKGASLSVTSKKDGWTTEVRDYNDKIVDVSWSYLPKLDWGVYTKINHDESFESIEYLKRIIVSICSLIIFFSIVIVTVFVQRFLTPIMRIRNNIVSLAKGHFPNKIVYNNQDEIQDTTKALNNLVERLKRSTDFAQRIGKGDFEARFLHTESQDVLSKALLSMRSSLVKIQEDNEKRKWITEGIALHSEVLRKNSENINKLGSSLIGSLVHYIGAHQGAIFAVNEHGTDTLKSTIVNSDVHYKLAGSYALDISEDEEMIFQLGQGLIGQCALDGELIYLKNPPMEFSKISSGLGAENATFVIIVPLKVNEEVMGVMEVASFNEFEDFQIEFLEKLAESIASSILAVKSTEKARQLLRDSQSITRVLKKREEDLEKEKKKMQKDSQNLHKKLSDAQEKILELNRKIRDQRD